MWTIVSKQVSIKKNPSMSFCGPKEWSLKPTAVPGHCTQPDKHHGPLFPRFLCSNHTLWFFSYPIFSPGVLRMLCPLYILPPYCHLAKLLPCIKHHPQTWTSSEAGTALIKQEFNQVGLPSPSCSHSCRIPPFRQLQGQGWRPSGLSPCPAPSTGPAMNWTYWGAHLLFYN